MTNEWEAGTQPWLRHALREGLKGQCPFCGQDSLVTSYGDLRDDNARLEVYCDSDRCDAREITVLVMRDATLETAQRPDVRALEAIETGKYTPERDRLHARTLAEIDADTTLTPEAVLTRRSDGAPVIDLRDARDIDPPVGT